VGTLVFGAIVSSLNLETGCQQQCYGDYENVMWNKNNGSCLLVYLVGGDLSSDFEEGRESSNCSFLGVMDLI
jgi:hypothetical protein